MQRGEDPVGLGAAAAIEKGEAEHLATLRQSHETRILQLARDVRFLQWKEAEAATETLLLSRATVWERYRHYKRILGVADADIDAVRVVDLVRQELTEETFDAAYAELVGAHTRALAREAYRKETSVGGLMEFAGNAVVEPRRRRAGQDAAAEQERERRAEHLPAHLRHVQHRRRRC